MGVLDGARPHSQAAYPLRNRAHPHTCRSYLQTPSVGRRISLPRPEHGRLWSWPSLLTSFNCPRLRDCSLATSTRGFGVLCSTELTASVPIVSRSKLCTYLVPPLSNADMLTGCRRCCPRCSTDYAVNIVPDAAPGRPRDGSWYSLHGNAWATGIKGLDTGRHISHQDLQNGDTGSGTCTGPLSEGNGIVQTRTRSVWTNYNSALRRLVRVGESLRLSIQLSQSRVRGLLIWTRGGSL